MTAVATPRTVRTNLRSRAALAEHLREALLVLGELDAMGPEGQAGAHEHEAHVFRLLLETVEAMGARLYVDRTAAPVAHQGPEALLVHVKRNDLTTIRRT